jgi:two-component sensor histidine kinase
VRLSASGEQLRLEVADQGVGLPDGFDFSEYRRSLGSRLIVNTARQLQAQVEPGANNPSGARFVMTMPIQPS